MNYRNRNGFTLIELLIVIVILGIFLGICGAIFVNCNSLVGSGKAEDFARQHVAALYPTHEVVGLSCVTQDSDGDGYVSCTVTIREGEGAVEALALECSRFTFGGRSGCRIAQPNIHTTVR